MNESKDSSLYYLKSAPIPRAIAHMALPMMAGMVLDLVYNMIDAFFVGQMRDTSMLAAVALAFPVPILLMGVAQIFGVGAGTLVPRLLGKGDERGAREASATAFYLVFAAGILLAALILPVLGPLVRLLGARGESYAPTYSFVLVSVLGSPFLVATPALAEMIRGEGSSKASMKGMMISVAANIAMDPLLIFGFRLGVAGAALATVIANAFAVAYFTWFLGRRSKAQSIAWRDFRPSGATLSAIFGVGSSALIFTALMLVSALVFNSLAMSFDESVVAAFGVANRVTQICEFLAQGLFAGVVPLLAFSYASGDRSRLAAVVKTCVGAFVIVTFAAGALLYGFRDGILRLFSSDPAVLARGADLLTAMLVAALFGGFANMFTDSFQAFGAAGPATLLSMLRGFALIPMLFLGRQALGLEGVIWALPVSDALGALAGASLWLLQGKKILSVPVEERGELLPQAG
jgi:putative MATE family efflux protein